MSTSKKSSVRQVVLTIQDENGNIISSFPTNIKNSDLQPEEPITSYAQLQQIADNLDNGLDDAVNLLTGPVISQLFNDPEAKSQLSSNHKDKTVKKTSTSLKTKKKILIQTRKGQSNVVVSYSPTDLKLNPNTTIRSIQVINIIAQEQAIGVSFRNESELLKLTNNLNVAPGTIHDIISRCGSYTRKK